MALFPYVAQTSNPVALLALLEIEGDAETIRIVNNNEDINSDGNKYTAYPFNLVLAGDTGDRQPEIKITIDNISPEILRALRVQPEPPPVSLKLVWSTEPDVIEKQIDFLKLGKVNYDALTITGVLTPQTFVNSQYPEGLYTGSEFPDLFFSIS